MSTYTKKIENKGYACNRCALNMQNVKQQQQYRQKMIGTKPEENVNWVQKKKYYTVFKQR